MTTLWKWIPRRWWQIADMHTWPGKGSCLHSNVFCLSQGEKHPHPQRAVLHTEWPVDSDTKSKETWAEGVFQGEDWRPVRKHLHVKHHHKLKAWFSATITPHSHLPFTPLHPYETTTTDSNQSNKLLTVVQEGIIDFSFDACWPSVARCPTAANVDLQPNQPPLHLETAATDSQHSLHVPLSFVGLSKHNLKIASVFFPTWCAQSLPGKNIHTWAKGSACSVLCIVGTIVTWYFKICPGIFWPSTVKL